MNYTIIMARTKEQRDYIKALIKWEKEEEKAFFKAAKTDPYINTQSMAATKWYTKYQQAHPKPKPPEGSL